MGLEILPARGTESSDLDHGQVCHQVTQNLRFPALSARSKPTTFEDLVR